MIIDLRSGGLIKINSTTGNVFFKMEVVSRFEKADFDQEILDFLMNFCLTIAIVPLFA